MIQIRNVPDDIHRQTKARAALLGMSMSDYVLQELKRALERPTREEILRRLRRAPLRTLTPSPAEILRQERDGR